jgi:hypothetical protein
MSGVGFSALVSGRDPSVAIHRVPVHADVRHRLLQPGAQHPRCHPRLLAGAFGLTEPAGALASGMRVTSCNCLVAVGGCRRQLNRAGFVGGSNS